MFDLILLNARNPGPMTGDGNNTYLLIGSNGRAVLIDAGVGDPRHLAEIAGALDRHGARLECLLVTHGHADHSGGAPALVAAHPVIRAQKFPWPEVDERQRVAWQPLADGESIAIGDDRLIALHTPGHSPDHFIFWHPASRTAFTGDLVVAGSSVMIHTSGGGHLGQYMASLERVRRLDAARLLPAHGAEVTTPAALLQGYLDHRRLRERQVIAALAAGCATVEAIAESIYHGLDPALLPAARENVRAHLDKLRTDGRAAEDNGTWTTSSISST
jgi:glyoxylase-like metal-dependent hydrolase (beta-lactamase superfamily II)